MIERVCIAEDPCDGRGWFQKDAFVNDSRIPNLG